MGKNGICYLAATANHCKRWPPHSECCLLHGLRLRRAPDTERLCLDEFKQSKHASKVSVVTCPSRRDLRTSCRLIGQGPEKTKREAAQEAPARRHPPRPVPHMRPPARHPVACHHSHPAVQSAGLIHRGNCSNLPSVRELVNSSMCACAFSAATEHASSNMHIQAAVIQAANE